LANMIAVSKTVSELTDHESTEILIGLTNPGSEFQQEVRNRHGSQTPIALVVDEADRVVAWVATHEWGGFQTLEGFTRTGSRRRGLAKLAASLLEAVEAIDADRDTAVFAPEFIGVAKAVGIKRIRLFGRNGKDWVETS
jgi:hypothetical protein